MAQGMINNRLFDMNRVDVAALLGATEIWLVHNVVGMDHPFHLHGFQFQILDRNGVPEPFRSWKDTVNVPKNETVRFIVRFADHPGKWMLHCHILDHEDQGMMGILEVTSEAASHSRRRQFNEGELRRSDAQGVPPARGVRIRHRRALSGCTAEASDDGAMGALDPAANASVERGRVLVLTTGAGTATAASTIRTRRRGWPA
jgi:hypothetical protein